ncbi:MAG TPA: DUF4097 family beta strand repeat-containing protein [Pyrinomonadaceae bacterium]|jgi:hypothetical protein
MEENCQNCGAELVAGQRYCRRCGAEISQSLQGELPTRVFTAEPVAENPASTSPLPLSHTDPVYLPRQTAFQPPLAPQTGIHTPPHAGSSRTWVIVGLGLCVLALGLVSLVLFVERSAPQPKRVVVYGPEQKAQPPRPPVPAERAGAAPLDEDDADVSDSKTVIEKSYALGKDSSVSIKNVSGDIKIEGWDEPQAEVKIIKEGGSAEEREAVPIISSSEKNNLTLESTPTGAGDDVKVRYEIRLPRNLAQLSITSVNSDVEVKNISGSIGVNLQQGTVELETVGGEIKTSVMNGNIKAELAGGNEQGALQFNTVKGNVELRLANDTNADVNAETIAGKIDFDENLALRIEKRPVGQRAMGQLGRGGHPLSIKTVSGNIKLKM